jgi:methanol--5-hydroxybenzimidazolylcobamide Co-methyltransferase
MRRQFTSIALDAPSLHFGQSRHPLIRNGVTIGDGMVIPEIKFTLAPILIEESNRSAIEQQYREMIDGVCQRAVDLHQTDIIVEFELLPQMTVVPAWGCDITRLLKEALEHFQAQHGIRYLLRVTPTDIREGRKPPLRREGDEFKCLLTSFQLCAEAGGDLLSIESIGGKEVTDVAITECDIEGVIFGAGVLGSADMKFLWTEICRIAERTNTIPAGDTACGIGNTAMVLADQNYIPKVFAAVVRAVTAVRSLVAYEVGAVGPGKDCGYENIFLKAITGLPMSLEGKSAACAHLSSIGNIAGAYADLWSNESVQDVRLLSGIAPVVSMEQLIYDCRLFNTATKHGGAGQLRDWLVESDVYFDPQAYIFRPDVVIELAQAIVSHTDPFMRSLMVARKCVECINQGMERQHVIIPDRERKWLAMLEQTLNAIPADPDHFIKQQTTTWSEHVDMDQYLLGD